MLDFINTFLLIGSTIALFVSSLFVLSLLVKRNDIADVAWGMGIFAVAAISYFLRVEENTISLLLLVLIGIWGLRLSVRIFLRNFKKSEDFRYLAWREEWGAWFYLRSYLQVYLLQGLLMIVVGYSAIHASVFATEDSFGLLAYIGIVVWIVGFVFESVGDWQLDRFVRSQPKPGTILDSGLWRYTRHPNYFGEVTMWWGVWFVVASVPMSYVALLSPIAITFLILKVSGIPLLERKFADNKQFATYKEKTNAFFPWFPKA
jgi:steroid 5-alpha reductase family enzyme